MTNRDIDIIIPIYNAYEDLEVCLSSVYKYTNLNRHKLILINDCSTDNRIESFLNKQPENNKNIVVIHNEINQGFSNNINIGINRSKSRDVILLNSDTVVTAEWVHKLIECAYSKEEIGTVTPLSNNATICSVPEFCEENELPNGYSIDSMGTLVERCSLNKYPKIEVAIGFCMFIKRNVLDIVGLFDAEAFGRGYGEENDFCSRAVQYGFTNVMCDNTYIYHTGTKSFITKEKQQYIDLHEAIIEGRYPIQKQAMRKHVQENPNYMIQENIKQYVRLNNGRQNILFLLHVDFRDDTVDTAGGIQLHAKDLVAELKRKKNIFVAARDGSNLRLTIYIDDCIFSYKFFVGEKTSYPVFYDTNLKKKYLDILNAFQINLVHVHHTLGLSLEMYYAADSLHIPIVTTIHDFYMICPTIKLLNTDNQICYFEENENECKLCLKQKLGLGETVDYLSYWREQNKKVLLMSNRIIMPSKSIESIILRYFPCIQNRTQIIEHGVNIVKHLQQVRTNTGKQFHVAFIGGINEEKGSKIICDAVKNSSKDIQWYVFGGIGDRELFYLNKNNLLKTGYYSRDELPKLITTHKIDLICILPIVAESFSYTLSEAIVNKVPVLVSNVGALGERVENLKCGWILSQKPSYQEVLEQINRLKDRNQEYLNIFDRVQDIKLKSIEQMGLEYKEIYEQEIIQDLNFNDYNAEEIFHAYLLGRNLENEAAVGINIKLLERLETAEQRLNAIYSSVTYKMALYITKIKIPGKNGLKALLYKIYKKK